MNRFQIRQFQIAYWEAGEGALVIFVHCSSASHKEWIHVARQYSKNYHVIAPDLTGYGNSTRWPENPPEDVVSDVEVIEQLINQNTGPVHLVGHSYGAAGCLEVARRSFHRPSNRICSMFLIEPVAIHLLRTEGYQKEWKQISRVARHCIDDAGRGNYKAAANSYMGFWIGALKWRLSPARFRKPVLQTITKVAYEFSTLWQYNYRAADYAHIECPVTFVSGERTKKPALRITELLTTSIPRCQHHTIPGAGHMSPFTHQSELKEFLAMHFRSFG